MVITFILNEYQYSAASAETAPSAGSFGCVRLSGAVCRNIRHTAALNEFGTREKGGRNGISAVNKETLILDVVVWTWVINQSANVVAVIMAGLRSTNWGRV